MGVLATADIFLFEGFRLDRRATVCLGAMNAVCSFQSPSDCEPSMFSVRLSNDQAISSRKRRSWRPSGDGRLSRMLT
jgi:hypothetical protein